MTDCVNNAVFPIVLISACKQIPEMVAVPANALEGMIPSLTFAIPYPKSDTTGK
jgi:hypothetical protein